MRSMLRDADRFKYCMPCRAFFNDDVLPLSLYISGCGIWNLSLNIRVLVIVLHCAALCWVLVLCLVIGRGIFDFSYGCYFCF
uniref:Uncharacterized protein n=1 Tax=Arundo donax TaxID=35708 RepID=A0A0A9E532_ARUDO